MTTSAKVSRPLLSRLAAPAVLVALLAATAAAFVTSRGVVKDQEDRLLAERADEVVALLTNAFGSIESSLRVLGVVGASADQSGAALFTESATPIVRGNTLGVAVATKRDGELRVATAVGTAHTVGQTLVGERAAAANRALTAKKLVSALFTDNGQTRLILALPTPSGDAVAFQESKLDPKAVTPSTPESPFRELSIVLYASPEADAEKLVVSTEKEVPLRGSIEKSTFAVGADQWLLVAGTREPLAGSFARKFPWLMLGGGVVMALLAATVIEVLARRRSYALGLVARRTGELEQALGDLAHVRAFLDRMVTSGPVLVARVTLPEREITYVSPNIDRLFGISAEQALAPGFLGSTVHPDDRDAYNAAFTRVSDGTSETEEIEYQFSSGNAIYRWVSADLVAEADDDGRVGAVLAYVVDADDQHRAAHARREAQEVAEAANRSKSEFLSRMSHELRTPLNAILGFGQVLELEELSNDQRDSVGHILKGGRHLLGLINEVLDISRIEAGEVALSPEAVLASDLIVEAADLMRPLADLRGIQLAVDLSADCDCFVFADRQRAKQIVLNLLSNAIKYNRAHGSIAVRCERPTATGFRINVSDTGHGIAAERLGLLFTPFERLGAETTDIEGTGIGLALSQRLAEAMGGHLTATSVLGKGSTFSVDLPLVEGPVQRYERLTERRPRATAPAAPKRRVLLIEDNPANIKLVERVFAPRDDVEVIAAMYGGLGLELAHEHKPVLILLDLHLPDMDGAQVLQRLRDDPVTASIPVAVVSADATSGQVQRLLAAGATAYLTKPIDVRELLGVLDEAVADSTV